LDSGIYKVTFQDGRTNEYAANVIIESIFQQVDAEGNSFTYFSEITDHRADDTALNIDNGYVLKNGDLVPVKTTKGWYLQIAWKDVTTTWEPLRDLKEAYPIEVAEYAIANKIDKQPAFAWWIPYVLSKRNRVIAAAKARREKKSLKFGIKIPHTIERALEIYRESGTNYWAKAIKKEMHHVIPVFRILDQDESAPIGSKFIRCHMHFKLKLDLTRKARFVAGGHMTDPPAYLTYSSAVTRDSVRLAFLMAALNDLDIMTTDIGQLGTLCSQGPLVTYNLFHP